MFVDDTNLLHSHKNVEDLFKTVNLKIGKNNAIVWSHVELSINIEITKFTLFYKNYFVI